MGMSTVNNSNAPPILVSEREAGRLLGVTPRTVFAFRQRGEIPHVKIGSRVLYPLAALERFVAENTEGAAAK